MKRTFILTATFERTWAALDLGDKELQALEEILLTDPDAGEVIQHLAGARKVRIPLEGRGKSGGGRVIYVDVVVKQRIYLLLAYPKNLRADMTPEQKHTIKAIIDAIKRE